MYQANVTMSAYNADLNTPAYSFHIRESFKDLPPLPDGKETFDDNLANDFLMRMKENPTAQDEMFVEAYRITFLTLAKMKTPGVQGLPPMLEILGLPCDTKLPKDDELKLKWLNFYRKHWSEYNSKLVESRALADNGRWPVTLRYGFIPPMSKSYLDSLTTRYDFRCRIPKPGSPELKTE